MGDLIDRVTDSPSMNQLDAFISSSYTYSFRASQSFRPDQNGLNTRFCPKGYLPAVQANPVLLYFLQQ